MQERTRVVEPTFGSMGSLTSRTDPLSKQRIETAMERALIYSYVKCPMRNRTDSSDQDRVKLCMALYVQCMEGDIPIQRVSDCLGNLLVIILEGGEVNLVEGGEMWCVSNSGIDYIVPQDSPDLNEEAELPELDIERALDLAAHNEARA